MFFIDPDYKSRFKQTLLEYKALNLNDSDSTEPNKCLNNQFSLLKNASKSFDNNINYVQYNKDLVKSNNYVPSSITTSNISTISNSNTNILNENSNIINNQQIDTSSLIKLKITDDKNLTKEEEDSNKLIITQPFLSTSSSSSSSSSSSPSSSSSLPVCSNSNELMSSSSSLSASSTVVATDLNNQTINININNNNNKSEQTESVSNFESFSQSTDQTNNNQNQLISNMTHTPVLTFQIEIDDSIKKKIDEKLKECSSTDSDSDSEQNMYTPKSVDLPSAQRLAKRLYFLDGFKPNDVFRHLSKKYLYYIYILFF